MFLHLPRMSHLTQKYFIFFYLTSPSNSLFPISCVQATNICDNQSQYYWHRKRRFFSDLLFSLRRPRIRREDDIEMYLMKMAHIRQIGFRKADISTTLMF